MKIALITGITGQDGAYLAELRELRYLILSNCDVSDSSIPVFNRLRSLEYLDLSGTRVTKIGITKLKQALPKCNVFN